METDRKTEHDRHEHDTQEKITRWMYNFLIALYTIGIIVTSIGLIRYLVS